MEDKKINISYSAADIKRYLSGEMSPQEMHAIEKAALDDHFLAEAMEGYENFKDGEFDSALAALKEKLTTDEKAKIIAIAKPPVLKWWRTAAAVLLIATTVTIAYLMTGNNATQNSIVSDTKKNADTVKNDVAKILSDSVNETATAANDVAINEAAQNDRKEKDHIINRTLPAQSTPDIVKQYNENAASKDITAKEAESKDEYKATHKEIATKNAPTFALEKPEAAKVPVKELTRQKNETAGLKNDVNVLSGKISGVQISDHNFNAQVLDKDNSPLAFASINVAHEKKIFQTDANGKVSLPSKDSTLDVAVSAVGYETKKITLKDDVANNKIVLDELKPQLNEVVVTGYGTKNMKKSRAEIYNAEPVAGWDKYQAYLHDSLVMPEDAKEKNIHGEVELSFDVKSNGKISRIKIIKPLFESCDKEAIRLIKNGPEWRTADNKKGRGKIKINF